MLGFIESESDCKYMISIFVTHNLWTDRGSVGDDLNKKKWEIECHRVKRLEKVESNQLDCSLSLPTEPQLRLEVRNVCQKHLT